MGVRSIRFYDLPAVRHIEADRDARLLWPGPLDTAPTTMHLALASAWQDVNQTVFTFVQRRQGPLVGLVQAVARPTRDAWDLPRLAVAPLTPLDPAPLGRDATHVDGERERIVDELLEAILQATASRGGLRTFARAARDSHGQELLARRGFRRYTDEYTLAADHLDVTPAPLPEQFSLRARRPADAWGIFQLYCSVAPAEVRHAEGLSSKRWGRDSLVAATVGRLRRPREIVLDDEGMVVGWVRLAGQTTRQPQRLEVMLHPRAGAALPALLAHAMVALEIRRDRRTVCHVRAYEDAVLHGLRHVGFDSIDEHALLVKHAVARVTERQLLLAALRAQSLGLDVSRSRQQGIPLSLVSRSQQQDIPHAWDPHRIGATILEHRQND